MEIHEDHIYLQVCDALCRRAQCAHRLVGAVVVWCGRIVGTGWNKPPRGEGLCSHGACPRGQLPPGQGTADYSDCIYGHAEFFALLDAGAPLCNGATLYVNSRPCPNCRKQAFCAGIARIVFRTAEGAVLQYSDHGPEVVTNPARLPERHEDGSEPEARPLADEGRKVG